MKKSSKETYGKDIKDKILPIGNGFLTKREVSTHETIESVLSLPMGHSNTDEDSEDSEVVEFIGTYITCALPNETK